MISAVCDKIFSTFKFQCITVSQNYEVQLDDLLTKSITLFNRVIIEVRPIVNGVAHAQ